MTVKELIKELRRENPKLEVRQFSHDHDPEKYDQGSGVTSSVWEVTNDLGETFVAVIT